MVRVASIFFLSGCVADDAYYHTQLLQTKISHKVSVDTSGNIDETNLFQKSMRQTSNSSKRAAEGAKLLKRFNKQVHLLKDNKQGSNKSGREGPEDEGAETCMMLYGHDVDMGKCAACYGEIAPHYDEEAMMEDPNEMVRTLADMADECMGRTNLITSTCEEYYGPDVLLFDCMMCGEMCQCTMEAECAAGPECHHGCMEGDAEMPDDSFDDDGEEECQLFYGPDASEEQCEECGHQCMEEANGAVESLAMSGTEAGMEDFERIWFEALISCADACMAPLVNLPEQACKAHYGEDVDLVACYTCGMMCGCDLEGNCEWCDHGGCMAGEHDSDSATHSSWLQKVQKRATQVAHPMHKSTKYQKMFQAAMTKIAPKKQVSDVTDLMQTRQHLKK